MEYLKELNQQQLEAATTTEGCIRVVAENILSFSSGSSLNRVE